MARTIIVLSLLSLHSYLTFPIDRAVRADMLIYVECTKALFGENICYLDLDYRDRRRERSCISNCTIVNVIFDIVNYEYTDKLS